MAFSYAKTSPADRDRVRLGLADTSESAGMFTDEELDDFLTRGGNVEKAIALGLKTLQAYHAHRGDLGRVAALQTIIDSYGGDLPTATVRPLANIPSDRGFTEPTS